MMDIIAAVSRKAGKEFLVGQLKLEAPRDHEVQIRIAGVGLCHSDLLARDGNIPVNLPAVFGHEGSGQVVAVGSSVKSVKVGDNVVMSFGFCGTCHSCGRGDMAYCDDFATLNISGGRADGSTALRDENGPVSSHFFSQSSFASHAVTDARNVVVLPSGAPVELLGPLGCGIQTGAGAVMNSLECRAGSSILITGGGSVGLSALLAAVVQGCSNIVVSEPHETRRALALELGATHVIDPMAEDVAGEVRAVLPDGVDYVFDATGIPNVITAGLSSLGKRGVMAVAGIPLDPQSAIPLAILPLVGLGQTIKGVVEGDADPQTFLLKLTALYMEGRFPIDRLITTYPLSKINDAVHDHEQGECVKAVLIP